MRILVLHQAVDPAREDEADTLIQVAEISACLQALGHEAIAGSCATLADVTHHLDRHNPEAVFNLVESFGGSDAHAYLAPAMLEMAHIPFTGNPADALFIVGDKRRMRALLAAHGIAVPAEPEVNSAKKYIVKSATEHASFGMDSSCVVTGAQNALALCQAKQAQYGGEWVAEEYIEGREINLSLLESGQGMQLLPPAEILFENWDSAAPRIVDYAAKWDAQSHGYHHTPRRFLPDGDSFLALAIRCWKALGLRGYARIDLRLDSEGNAYVIDVNPNPCLSADAGFVAAAQQAGMTQTDIVHSILKAASHEYCTETTAAA